MEGRSVQVRTVCDGERRAGDCKSPLRWGRGCQVGRGLGAGVGDLSHDVCQDAEAFDFDGYYIARTGGVGGWGHDAGAGQEPGAGGEGIGRVQDGDELGRDAHHVGNARRAAIDFLVRALDRQIDTCCRGMDMPGRDDAGTEGAAGLVDLCLGEVERVFALDTARAHVVAAGVADDLAVGVRQHGQLRLRNVPGRVGADAYPAAGRDYAPAGALEEELRPGGSIDGGVDVLLGRFFNARFAAAEV